MSTLPSKIKDLLHTHNGEYTYIAIQLMVQQLGYSPEQALKEVPFLETAKEENSRNFTWELYLGGMELEYRVVEGYVPYMGADVTAARILRVEQGGQLELVPDVAGYLALEDDQSQEEIQQILQEDYHQLIPQLWAWLDNPLEALL